MALLSDTDPPVVPSVTHGSILEIRFGRQLTPLDAIRSASLRYFQTQIGPLDGSLVEVVKHTLTKLDQPVGFIGTVGVGDNDYVQALKIEPSAQRAGLGRLMQALTLGVAAVHGNGVGKLLTAPGLEGPNAESIAVKLGTKPLAKQDIDSLDAIDQHIAQESSLHCQLSQGTHEITKLMFQEAIQELRALFAKPKPSVTFQSSPFPCPVVVRNQMRHLPLNEAIILQSLQAAAQP